MRGADRLRRRPERKAVLGKRGVKVGGCTLLLLLLLPLSLPHPQCQDASPPHPANLTWCSRYANLSCCAPPHELTLKARYQRVEHYTRDADWKRCQAMLKELLCSTCSPRAAHVFPPYNDGRERTIPGLCPQYCRAMYSQCRDLVWLLDKDLAASRLFSSQSAFCNASELEDMSYCFPESEAAAALPESRQGHGHHATSRGCLCLEPAVQPSQRANFDNPIFARHAGDGSGRMFVGEQTGKVFIVDSSQKKRHDQPFMDISDRLKLDDYLGDERGLGGLTFHPQFNTNGRLFVYYNAPLTYAERHDVDEHLGVTWDHQSVLLERRVQADSPDHVDPDWEKVLLRVKQPYPNHNGGELFFLDDGYLYLTLGDGGNQGDPHNLAQNTSWLLGKVLRLDVDSPPSAPLNYSVPPDNPFVDQPGARPEIFTYGMRNPWRCGVDTGHPVTGEGRGRVLCGDVGQSKFEEVDLLKKGGNYGWRSREGNECYDQKMCNNVGKEELPVYVYDHTVGQSITGGQFYRGCRSPSLQGKYIFGDYQSARLFSLEEGQGARWEGHELSLCSADLCAVKGLSNQLQKYILSFDVDQAGEVYILTSQSSTVKHNDGAVFMLVDPFSQKTAAECAHRKQKPTSPR